MAYYKIYNTGSGEISNIIEWNGTGSFTWPSGYDIALYTGSLSGSDQWSGSVGGVSTQAGLFFGELTGAASGSFTGSFTGSLNGYTGSLTWIYDFPTVSYRTGSFTGSLSGSYNDYSGSLGWLDEWRYGTVKLLSGSFTGSLSGSLTGSLSGSGTGSFSGSFTGSFSGSFTGSLAGSASYATTASYLIGGGGASVTSPGDNRIITSDGTSTGLIAESNMSFTGTNLLLTGSLLMTGSITMNTGSINNPVLTGYYETMVSKSVANDFGGGIVNIDLRAGNVHKLKLDANVMDLNISNNPTALQAGSFTLVLEGDGTARTFSWGSETNFLSGTPAVPSGSGQISIYSFVTVNSGTDYLVLVIADNQSGLV